MSDATHGVRPDPDELLTHLQVAHGYWPTIPPDTNAVDLDEAQRIELHDEDHRYYATGTPVRGRGHRHKRG